MITMAQDIQKKLAATSVTHVIHCNAGLRALCASGLGFYILFEIEVQQRCKQGKQDWT